MLLEVGETSLRTRKRGTGQDSRPCGKMTRCEAERVVADLASALAKNSAWTVEEPLQYSCIMDICYVELAIVSMISETERARMDRMEYKWCGDMTRIVSTITGPIVYTALYTLRQANPGP